MVKKTLLFTFVIAPLMAFILVGIHVTVLFNQPYTGEDIVFTVHNGDTFGRVNQRLYDQKIINNTRLFHYLAKYKGVLTKLRAGDFTIKTGSSMPQVLDTLIYGQPNLKIFTIPEGRNMYEVAKIVASIGITSEEDFLKAATDPELLKEMGITAESAEGYLFPETYHFAPNSRAKTVVKAMIDQFNKKTESINFDHPFLDKHQVVILASMVEKETGAKFERNTIAGVFTNRLKKKMRLQSDPTTIYGIWHRYDGNIRRKDLQEHTPYNTYRIPGLPKGPIANPSLEAIKAALNPEDHKYLFFVSKNDGTHIFTETYKEHSKAVNDYQKNVKARQGKSWRDLKQD
ncbi:MAG TPA: endolytic transglycosylase MltG [Bacteriovoracaceae bacterium]|nr:endolytic transglycosylase MltG [Bacteriovoracaceae bacterium]HLW57926.1 endolytic transglycosylase MltG [Bacteriovoracaceae bacterium]